MTEQKPKASGQNQILVGADCPPVMVTVTRFSNSEEGDDVFLFGTRHGVVTFDSADVSEALHLLEWVDADQVPSVAFAARELLAEGRPADGVEETWVQGRRGNAGSPQWLAAKPGEIWSLMILGIPQVVRALATPDRRFMFVPPHGTTLDGLPFTSRSIVKGEKVQ